MKTFIAPELRRELGRTEPRGVRNSAHGALSSRGSRGLLGWGTPSPVVILGLGAAEPVSSKHLAQEAATTTDSRKGHINNNSQPDSQTARQPVKPHNTVVLKQNAATSKGHCIQNNIK